MNSLQTNGSKDDSNMVFNEEIVADITTLT